MDKLSRTKIAASGVDVTDRELFVPYHLRRQGKRKAKSFHSQVSSWNMAFHELLKEAATDERYEARDIKLYTGNRETGLAWDSDTEVDTPPVKVLSSGEDRPFMYSNRPFRLPSKASEESKESSEFVSVEIRDSDWDKIVQGNNKYLESKWTHSEPIRADEKLLPSVDPLVQYKLRKMGKKRVYPEQMVDIQRNLEVSLTPSGRKINGYSSDSSVEEVVFTRIRCKDDPEFDLGEPFLVTEDGDKWPHPFLNYWNWKRTEDDPNLGYFRFEPKEKNEEMEERLRIAAEIIDNPMKLPDKHLGADDTDYEDPLGPLVRLRMSTVLSRIERWVKKKHGLKKPKRRKTDVYDKVSHRYAYLMMSEYSRIYKYYYKVKWVGWKGVRGLSALGDKMRPRYTISCFPCLTSYPCWFVIWKYLISKLVRIVPRHKKFSLPNKVKTAFYGTLASLYATQYLIEYDILPNMGDPVNTSKEALESALKLA